MGRINDNPCHHCVPPKRNEWCHATCKEYIDWKANLDAQAQRVYRERMADVILAEGAMERKRRHYRRGGKH